MRADEGSPARSVAARLGSPALALVLAAHASGCASRKAPNPDEVEHTAVLARVANVEQQLEENEKKRATLAARLELAERTVAAMRPPDKGEVATAIAALESRIAALEEKNAFLELKVNGLPEAKNDPNADSPVKIIDHHAAAPREPATGEVVTALIPIDGETFAFRQGQTYDRARLLGIETPLKPQDYESDPDRRARAVAAWGEAVVASDDSWQRARDRLSELLTGGELSFSYSGKDDHREAQGRARLLVYAHVKKPSGEVVTLNDVLVEEGLALAHGSHERATELEKLGEAARREKLGLYGGH